ncbi:hypothetical protein ACFL96_07460 [Thermoproteota archaeon]
MEFNERVLFNSYLFANILWAVVAIGMMVTVELYGNKVLLADFLGYVGIILVACVYPLGIYLAVLVYRLELHPLLYIIPIYRTIAFPIFTVLPEYITNLVVITTIDAIIAIFAIYMLYKKPHYKKFRRWQGL